MSRPFFVSVRTDNRRQRQTQLAVTPPERQTGKQKIHAIMVSILKIYAATQCQNFPPMLHNQQQQQKKKKKRTIKDSHQVIVCFSIVAAFLHLQLRAFQLKSLFFG
jgi:hypothetical protein